ncbi:H-NS histone family protein [Xanthomonas campestris pv. phormiicola]|nr:H-NS histone family protein [Xanthomonas campestris pv. phormiicola]UYC17406.1 H-NS histone family protein [Xanthomonas campestris pv. phormiicola]
MSDKKTVNLQSITQAKAKLAEELRELEVQEAQLLQSQAMEAFSAIVRLLAEFSSHFSAKQKAEVATLVGAGEQKPKKSANATRSEAVPKYWLPHSHETWSGRGRMPRAFAAWEGTAAYNEWKARHPDQKFPAFPG